MVLTSAAATRPRQRRSPALLAAFAVVLAIPAAAQDRRPTGVSPPPMEDTPLGRAGDVAPGGADPARPFPQVSLDVDMNLYAIGTPAASGRGREGFSGFLFGHINPGVHLTPDFSLQAFIHPDPAGDFEPNGAVTFLRRQNAILEQLFAEWRPVDGFQVYAGKFNAPFGYSVPKCLRSPLAFDVITNEGALPAIIDSPAGHSYAASRDEDFVTFWVSN